MRPSKQRPSKQRPTAQSGPEPLANEGSYGFSNNYPQRDSNPCLQDQNLISSDGNSCDKRTYNTSSGDLADFLAFLCGRSPELTSVVAAWDELPEHVRAAIVTLVESVRENMSAR